MISIDESTNILKGQNNQLQNLKTQGVKRHTNSQIDRAKFRIETRRQSINGLIAPERQARQFNSGAVAQKNFSLRVQK